MTPTELQVRLYQPSQSSAVVEVSGDVDVISIKPFAETLREAAGACPLVIVDLTGANYIDTAGLQELVNAHKTLLHKKGELVLVVKPSSQPEYVIHTVLLDSLVSVFQSLEPALQKAEDISAS